MAKVRKGFTLVELLIVIVIIGILAAAMLLSSGSATAAAEASNIISEMRNMKAAAMMFYADSMDAFLGGNTAGYTAITASGADLLARYMDNSDKMTGNAAYLFAASQTAPVQGKWFVGFNLSSTGLNTTVEVREKLAGKTNTTGLIGTAAGTKPNTLTPDYTKGNTAIWMVAR